MFKQIKIDPYIQTKICSFTSIMPLLYYGKWFVVPFQRPVTVVFGNKIQVDKIEFPTVQEIDSLHEMYMKELTELFEKYKDCYALDRVEELTFI